jgi:hypothetical protein
MKQTLPKAIQRFIVQQLAYFESPAEVVATCKAEFDVQVTRQTVEHYDPTRGGEAKRLAQEHVELFHAARTRFISQLELLGIAHKAYRLSQIEQIMRKAKLTRNWFLAAQMLEQGAKEMGGIYTNKREHSGPGGGPIPVSLESRKRELATKMLEKLTGKGISEEEARASLISLGVDEYALPSIQRDRT